MCFRRITLLLLCVSAASGQARAASDEASEPRPGHPVIISTRYVGDRFAAVPTVEKGGVLTFLTDSAGGTFLFAHVADRLQLARSEAPGEGERDKKLRVAQLPAFKSGAAIPPPLGMPGGSLFVFKGNPQQIPKFFQPYDGLLGQQWFAGRVWTFDYPGRQLLLRAAGDVPRHDAAHERISDVD
jgi:hypothetical protein